MREKTGTDCSRKPAAASFFSTKSARSPSTCKPSYCASSKKGSKAVGGKSVGKSRHAHRFSLQPRSGTSGRTRPLSAGPLLSAECYSHRIAAATRAAGRYSSIIRALLAQICASDETRDKLHRPGGTGGANELSLAGKCAELEHTIERAVLLGKDTTIGLKDLPLQSQVSNGSSVPLAAAVANGYTLRELEREYILRVIESTYGNKAEAARILGVDRTPFIRKLEEYKVKT